MFLEKKLYKVTDRSFRSAGFLLMRVCAMAWLPVTADSRRPPDENMRRILKTCCFRGTINSINLNLSKSLHRTERVREVTKRIAPITHCQRRLAAKFQFVEYLTAAPIKRCCRCVFRLAAGASYPPIKRGAVAGDS